MVSERVIRDRKGKSAMGRDHDAEASMSGDSHIFLANCTRDFDFSMLASRMEEEVAYMTSSASLELDSQDEEELTEALAGRGRTSRELYQILSDAKDFIGAPRNNKTERKQPDRYQAFVAQDGEPASFQQATQRQVWLDAMVEEYNSIMVNDIWEVVPRPQDISIVGSRWIYKIKYATDDSVEKYKARFVAKGYAQKEGIDYEETFTLVARYTSIRNVIFLASQMEWKIHQMDVKTTFLNRVIEEEVYIEQPEGFKTHKKKSHVCRLKKTLYGLKHAP
eukprot:PITA_21783